MKILPIAPLALLMAVTVYPAHADILHQDDVIVFFSECIGNDCVNGESFGFDTLRLKENNLRINFYDTSNSASFPSNDWRITINDSSNGGGNYFLIEDATNSKQPFRIDAGAPTNSLRIEATGDVGIGTSNPAVNLHIKEGNTPTLRLEQDSSAGFTAQTWDVAGNEANFFIRDVTNSSALPFRIFPSSSNDNLLNLKDGKVGIGTTSPDAGLHVLDNSNVTKFHVAGTGTHLAVLESTNGGAIQFRLKSDSVDNRRIVAVDNSDSVKTQLLFNDDSIELLGINTSAKYATFNSTGLEVYGTTITLNGSVIHPDYVFEKSYQLPSISEQARQMWTQKHLPAVGSGTNSDGTTSFDLVKKTFGMLEEIEKAHIYIEQLHKRLEKVELQLKNSKKL